MRTGSNSTLRVARGFVNFTWYLGLAGFVIMGIFALIEVFSPETLSLASRGSLVVSPQILGPGIILELSPEFISPELYRLPGLVWGIGFVAIGVVFFAIHTLREILATVSSGTPFVTENAIRLRHIGFAIIAGGVLKVAVEMIVGLHIARYIKIPGVGIGVRSSLGIETFLFGLLVLVLAEIFRFGTELQEEHDLTV